MMTQLHKIANFIGGQMSSPISNLYLDNFEPATGQPYSLIPDSDQDDVKQAVKTTKKALVYPNAEIGYFMDKRQDIFPGVP